MNKKKDKGLPKVADLANHRKKKRQKELQQMDFHALLMENMKVMQESIKTHRDMIQDMRDDFEVWKDHIRELRDKIENSAN